MPHAARATHDAQHADDRPSSAHWMDRVAGVIRLRAPHWQRALAETAAVHCTVRRRPSSATGSALPRLAIGARLQQGDALGTSRHSSPYACCARAVGAFRFSGSGCHGICRRGRALSWCRCGRVGPVPVQMWAGASPVPVQMWQGRALSWCRCGSGGWCKHRCGRGEPSPGADVA